jgi:glucose/arabinose dehydrogenase
LSIRTLTASAAMLAAASLPLLFPASHAQDSTFHNAPPSTKNTKNPFASKDVSDAKPLYQSRCAACHGPNGEGSGNIPSLAAGKAQSVPDGEVFWYITKGDVNNGMPSWQSLPDSDRWKLVTFIKHLSAANSAANANAKTPSTAAPAPAAPAPASEPASSAALPMPTPPFTDYRFEAPGKIHKITVADLPEPFATQSAGNSPKLAPRPENAWPIVPEGFKVAQYATDLGDARLIRTAPNGDFFVAASRTGEITVFRGITSEGKPEKKETFATGLNRPFGINFYPPGANPEWIYVGNTDAVVRFPYRNGDLKARGPAEKLTDLPSAGKGHWTRDIQFTPDGKKMLVSVGSASNVDDPDSTPGEKNRADVLEFNPDGSGQRVFAYGIRNCVGLAISPETGEPWCSVNERDALGDNLVPDYITHVQQSGYYGWPWFYMGGHQDPRHVGKHPELKSKVITPDVILHPHFASLEMTFYQGQSFPREYKGDIFAAEHGSWNRAARVGYELIRIPLHQSGKASGEYEDFMTGFVIDSEHVWGRPVGVTVAPDGSLLVTDDGSKTIWRITYTGK